MFRTFPNEICNHQKFYLREISKLHFELFISLQFKNVFHELIMIYKLTITKPALQILIPCLNFSHLFLVSPEDNIDVSAVNFDCVNVYCESLNNFQEDKKTELPKSL